MSNMIDPISAARILAEGSSLTQEEIDALMSDLSDNPWSPMPTPIEFDPPEREMCPDCVGSGKYIGALVVEDCKRCKGIGQI